MDSWKLPAPRWTAGLPVLQKVFDVPTLFLVRCKNPFNLAPRLLIFKIVIWYDLDLIIRRKLTILEKIYLSEITIGVEQHWYSEML